MKKLLLLVLCITGLTGCICKDVLLKPSNTLHKTAHKELMNKYIPNDSDLSEADKKIRLDALKSYGELLQKLNENDQ